MIISSITKRISTCFIQLLFIIIISPSLLIRHLRLLNLSYFLQFKILTMFYMIILQNIRTISSPFALKVVVCINFYIIRAFILASHIFQSESFNTLWYKYTMEHGDFVDHNNMKEPSFQAILTRS